MPLSFRLTVSRSPQPPNFSLRSSLLDLQGQLSQVTAQVQKSRSRIHRIVGGHVANLAIQDERRVYPFHLSSRGRRILQRGSTIQRCSTLFPSYACGEHLLMSGSRALKPTTGSQSLVRRQSAILSPSSSSSSSTESNSTSPSQSGLFWEATPPHISQVRRHTSNRIGVVIVSYLREVPDAVRLMQPCLSNLISRQGHHCVLPGRPYPFPF